MDAQRENINKPRPSGNGRCPVACAECFFQACENSIIANNRQCHIWESDKDSDATDAPIGSRWRVEIMADRLARGESLFNAQDSKWCAPDPTKIRERIPKQQDLPLLLRIQRLRESGLSVKEIAVIQGFKASRVYMLLRQARSA